MFDHVIKGVKIPYVGKIRVGYVVLPYYHHIGAKGSPEMMNLPTYSVIKKRWENLHGEGSFTDEEFITPVDVFRAFTIERCIYHRLYVDSEIMIMKDVLDVNILMVTKQFTGAYSSVVGALTALTTTIDWWKIIDLWLEKMPNPRPDLLGYDELTLDNLARSSTRKEPYPYYMHFIRYLLRVRYGMTLKLIASITGTEHSTVIHSKRAVEDELFRIGRNDILDNTPRYDLWFKQIEKLEKQLYHGRAKARLENQQLLEEAPTE